MVLTLENMSNAEAEVLGKEFCYENDSKYYGIKRVPRDWAPDFANNGVCVFLYPTDDGYACMARDERPNFCVVFKCTSGLWAPRMDFVLVQAQYKRDEKLGVLSEDELADRWKEVRKARERTDL
jgi:hypothetical protein